MVNRGRVVFIRRLAGVTSELTNQTPVENQKRDLVLRGRRSTLRCHCRHFIESVFSTKTPTASNRRLPNFSSRYPGNGARHDLATNRKSHTAFRYMIMMMMLMTMTTMMMMMINIIIISKTMFTVLSSWQSHCESSPGSFDECRTAPSGRRSKTKPDDLGCESACTGCQNLHPPSPFIIITQPECWYSFYRPTEGRRLSRPSWLVTYRDGLPVHILSLIEANALPLSQTANQ